jgi:hypothetical protein
MSRAATHGPRWPFGFLFQVWDCCFSLLLIKYVDLSLLVTCRCSVRLFPVGSRWLNKILFCILDHNSIVQFNPLLDLVVDTVRRLFIL